MTKEEIIEMAKQAGYLDLSFDRGMELKELRAFAKLVAEKEREECAKICDEQANGAYWEGADVCAWAIRERGKK